MTRFDLTLKMTDADGSESVKHHTVETKDRSDDGALHRVFHVLQTELRVTVGEQASARQHERARAWMNFSGKPVSVMRFFDIRNVQTMWLELSNLIIRAEADLVLAQAFKALEPAQEPPFEDSAAINDLYFIHDRKMTLLNMAVWALVKVEDLVFRLLHESLGGDLVDATLPNWESRELRRENVLMGLKVKHARGLLSDDEHKAIREAFAIPRRAPKRNVAKNYRNLLMHHARPSVDYPMFFSILESRKGKEMKDASGKVIGRQFTLGARPSLEYSFRELHEAFSAYLDAVADMLQRLSEIELLHP